MYGYRCELCDGVVREQYVKKEIFKHKNGFVMLENIPIGICNKCGFKYYHSKIIKRVEEIGEGKRAPERTEAIPVAHLK